MKKILSIFMALVIAVTGLSLSAFAAKEDVTPVIVVGGVGTRPYYKNLGEDNEESVFPPTVDYASVISKAVVGIASAILTSDISKLSSAVSVILEEIFDGFMCDENGNSKYANVSTPTYKESLANYDFDYANDVSEVAVAGTCADKIGAENVYFYNYDWRIDPCGNASGLNTAVKKAKEETGSDKVILIPCSMGGVQTMAYLEEYGYNDVEKIIFMSSAHKGLLLVSELFGGNIEIDQKNIFMFFSKLLNIGNENTDNVFDFICSYLGSTPYLNKLFEKINGFSLELSNETVYETMRKVFGTMPGMWAFVCDDYFDKDFDFMINGNMSEELIAKIEHYHKNVGSKNNEILKEAAANGVAIDVFSHYDRGSVPVTQMASAEGDTLIETVCTSIGAYVSPMGETLGENYEQVKNCGGHSHVSKDLKIDASTCLFPDSTWFIKGEIHVGCKYGSDYGKLISLLITSKGQDSVYDYPEYPQFLKSDIKEMTLTEITEPEKEIDLKSEIKKLFESIKNIIGSNA